MVPGEMDAKNRQCVTNAFCKALNDLIKTGRILGFGFGIPCYVAGTAMFCACYACCCCRTNFAEDATSKHAAPRSDNRPVDFVSGDEDFPGAEFYPVSNGPNMAQPQVPPAQPGQQQYYMQQQQQQQRAPGPGMAPPYQGAPQQVCLCARASERGYIHIELHGSNSALQSVNAALMHSHTHTVEQPVMTGMYGGFQQGW